MAFLVLDGIWLGVVARSFYQRQLGILMREKILKAPAGVFYIFYALGLIVLAVKPVDATVTLLACAVSGALVGFLSYGTYNMTNLSTLEGWPKKMSFVDWAWGSIVSALASLFGRLSLSIY